MNAIDILNQLAQGGMSGSGAQRYGRLSDVVQGGGASASDLEAMLGVGQGGGSGQSGGYAPGGNAAGGGNWGGGQLSYPDPASGGRAQPMPQATPAGGGIGSALVKGAIGAGALVLIGKLTSSLIRGASAPAQAAPAPVPAAPIPTPVQAPPIARRVGSGTVVPPAPAAAPVPQATMPPPLPPAAAALDPHATAMLLIRAMVNAAKADGTIDDGEVNRIVGKLQESGADDEAKQFVIKEFNRPLDMAGRVADVPNDEIATQVYAASLMAIEVDTPAEQQYLQTLAEGLGLDPATVAQLHRIMGVPA